MNREGAPLVHWGAVSLFAGCGGFCEGIERAGFRVVNAVEVDRFAAQTYRFNFPTVPLFEGDVRHYLNPDAPDGAGNGFPPERLPDKTDLVFGGPPCQGFSQIGTRRPDDDRNTLFQEFVRVVQLLRPRVFLMENVPNLVMMAKGHFKRLIIETFQKAGYKNTIVLPVVASKFGVPQERRRVVFMGVRDDSGFAYDLERFTRVVLAQRELRRPVTVWEAIGDLPAEVVGSGRTVSYATEASSDYQRMMRLDAGWPPYPRDAKVLRGIRHFDGVEVHNHHTKKIQERRLGLITMLEPGARADTLPKDVWNGTRPWKWRRLHPDRPTHTVTAQMHRDLSEFVHPKLDRWITVREAARLQSFHDGFVFVTSERQQLKQIGNAVPPLLGRALGSVAAAILYSIESGSPPAFAMPLYTQEALVSG